MGLMNKIEEVLSGSNKRQEEESKLEKPAALSKHDNGGLTQRPLADAYGNDSQQRPSELSGVRAHERQHPSQRAPSHDPSGAGLGNEDHQGQKSGTQKTHANEPCDPYTSRGQRTAAAGVQDRTGYDMDSGKNGRLDQTRPVQDPDLARSRHDGVTNSLDDQRYASGSQSSVGNRNAVPTAGGERLGTTGDGNMAPNSEHPKHQQPHLGRDAAVVGGVGATGIGAHEIHKDRRNPEMTDAQQQYSRQQTSQDTYGSGTDKGTVVSAGQTGPVGGMSQRNAPQSTATQGGDFSSGRSPAKKMGGTYEAGYRDAMEHMKAEIQRKGLLSDFQHLFV